MACRTKGCALGAALFIVFVGVALICLGLLLAPPAKGEALHQNHDSCAHLGSLTVDVIETKATGVTWAAMEEFMKGKLAEAKGNPQSYIQTDADVAYVLRMLKAAWHSNQLSYEAGTNVYRDCMAKRV